MTEYFSDKDDQSFDMPNDDPSAPGGSGTPVPPPTASAPDESGFGSTTGGGNQQQQDVVYFAILALIIGVMIYTLYAMFFSSGPASAEQIQPVPVEAQSKPQQTEQTSKPQLPRIGQRGQDTATPAVTTPAPAMPTVVSQITTVSPPVAAANTAQKDNQPAQPVVNNTRLNDLIEENSVLSAAVRRLTDSNDKADQRMTELESEVDDLVATLDDTKAQLAALIKQIAEQNTPKKVKKELTYNIQAVVEGRAWLQSSAGTNITVKVGDELKGYGVVTRIDAVNSVIQTSSGKAIRVN